MGRYHVLEPLSFVKSGKVIHYTHPATDVLIDDAVAAKLGDKVRRSGEPETPEPDDKPEPKTSKATEKK